MLEARNIYKTYSSDSKELEVLKGVNLYIAEGEFCAIVGPSGAGKSTLLHILGGLDYPTRGEVILGQEEIYSLDDQALSLIRNKKIGFVFQFYHLLSEFTVLENVMMPGLISHKPPPCGGRQAASHKLKEKAEELLKQVGLSDRATHFPSQLSGGERQRVAIARGLINQPQALLCDEPTGNLDSKSGQEIFALLKNINSENRMSIVLVTHNLELAKAAGKVYHLKDGLLFN